MTTRALGALAAGVAVALVAGACTRTIATSSSINPQPQDIYGAMPSTSDVGALLGDDN